MHSQGRTHNLAHSPIGAAFGLLAAHTPVRPLLNLSQAAPSFAPPAAISERVAQVAHEPDGGRYVPQQGLAPLRRAFADELSRDHNATIDDDEVLITAGCNQAFCVTASALTIPGDNIVLAVPYYFNHEMWLTVEGVESRMLEPGKNLVPSVDDAAKLIDHRTRAIVLVTPGNPSGVTLKPDIVHGFFDLCRERGIALIIDETYRSFRAATGPSHLLYQQSGWQNTLVTLHSFSKDLAIPGYRVGAAVGAKHLLGECMKIVDCIAICAPRIGQEAALAGLRHAGEWRSVQTERIADLHRQFQGVMQAEPGGFELVSSGAYFGWVRHPWPQRSTLDVIGELLTTRDVLAIPGTAFTPDDRSMIRMSFANLNAAEIDELATRLAE